VPRANNRGVVLVVVGGRTKVNHAYRGILRNPEGGTLPVGVASKGGDK